MTSKIVVKVLLVIIAVVLFPITIPLLVVDRVKKKRRKHFSKSYAILKAQGLEPALGMLEKNPKTVPAGASDLFHAFDASTDAEWQTFVNAWLGNVSPVKIALAPGAEPRFHRITFSALDPCPAPEKITVIMPAFNSGPLIRPAVRSILNQTWSNLELIVVNDNSSDNTGEILEELAQTDGRMRVLHNKVNVGPYVSKNIALSLARGEFVTGHDADDLAMPDRLARQVEVLLGASEFDAVVGHMVRLDENGLLSYASDIYRHSFDGLHRLAMISLMIRRSMLADFGYWDSVRFMADSELLGRLKATLGHRLKISRKLTMLCLDEPGSLTNHSEHGIDRTGAVSSIRQEYKDSWQAWHKTGSGSLLHRKFSNDDRPFTAPPKMVVPQSDIELLKEQYGIKDAPAG